MGCGGSRTDALEPRYLESWTKETESTWLPSTDTDIPLSSIHSIPSENSSEMGFIFDKSDTPVADFFDDGVPAPAQAYLTVCSAMSEASLDRGNPDSPPAIQASQHQDMLLASTGSIVQRRSVLRTEEITKWQDNRMSTKQVTITVTQSIRQVDKSGKVKEKSLTTYEVMKPMEALKEVTTENTEVH
ncbi:brain and acute leukemia cytoplasmic protein [Hypomesus transpacificus]|uniref:brain and acute leukemia cytoplasmic protein n=1 Tax=Hypomesus transpacificus TaxID=137520 RepID=UPI001F084371|nr:brain and acute leukemia cytoplasmic protein [Hypomesus transpacificus]XP_046877238.1 brain and acute leukemia cytoplasmic protein [Hypomesus transpacificus]